MDAVAPQIRRPFHIDLVVMALAVLEQGALPLLVRRIEHEAQVVLRTRSATSCSVRAQRQIGRDNREHRRHDIAGDRAIVVAARLQSRRRSGIETKLLPGFAQSCRDSRLAGIDPAAGKRDLACVRSHMLASQGQDDAGLRPIRYANKHRRGHRRLCSLPRAGRQSMRGASGSFSSAADRVSNRLIRRPHSKGKECPAAPHARWIAALVESNFGKLVIDAF